MKSVDEDVDTDNEEEGVAAEDVGTGDKDVGGKKKSRKKGGKKRRAGKKIANEDTEK